MGKNKSSKNIEGEMKSEDQQLEKEGGTHKQDHRSVVLKVEFHCEGCVRKILKAVRSFKGVEKVTCDCDTNKVTAIGEVDALKLKEKVERKMKRPVQLISPLPKAGSKEKKPNENESKGNKGDDKKTKVKEPPITTTVLKLHLHCEGCIQKIHKTITKNRGEIGYKEIKIDHEKELVTVTGSMDMKELVETLKKQLKKDGGGDKKDVYEYQDMLNFPLEWDTIFCSFCRIKIASIEDCVAPYLSTNVMMRGPVAIYDQVFNVHNVNVHQERFGAEVADTNCSRCGNVLGWKLIQMKVENDLYRAGRYIIKLNSIRYSADYDEDLEGADSNEENVDQDLDGNGLNADQHGVANEQDLGANEPNVNQDLGANEPNANQDLGANEQVPKESELGINEPNAEPNAEQNLVATEQKADQDVANNQVQQDLGADQDGGVNEHSDDDKDGGRPRKQRKIN